MEYIDMRKISAGEAKQIRRQIVRLKKMGKSGKEIEEIVGVRQNRISEIWTAYQRDGEEALSRKKTGRKVGSGMILTPEEQEKIRGIIIETRPVDHGMAGYLWTRNKVCELVRSECKKSMTPESVSNYMKRWGLTCQRPAKRARKQNADRESFRKIGLTFEEKAFYDILISLRDEYNFEYGTDKTVNGININAKCKSLARKIKEIIDTKSSLADWLNNQIIRNQLKFDIKVCLIKNGYPPQYSPEVFRKVMEQVENFEEND